MITWNDVVDRITRIEKRKGGTPLQVRVLTHGMPYGLRFGKHHNSKAYVFKKRQPKTNHKRK